MPRPFGGVERSKRRSIDIFDGDDIQIAILDTTVNHMSEVFEFQFEPDVLGHADGGLHYYILAGCTCLAGDVFGQYSFDRAIDDRLQNHVSQYGSVYDV